MIRIRIYILISLFNYLLVKDTEICYLSKNYAKNDQNGQQSHRKCPWIFCQSVFKSFLHLKRMQFCRSKLTPPKDLRSICVGNNKFRYRNGSRYNFRNGNSIYSFITFVNWTKSVSLSRGKGHIYCNSIVSNECFLLSFSQIRRANLLDHF